MRFVVGKLSIFLVFLTFPYFIPASSHSSWCSFWLARGEDTKSFGKNGQDGNQGKNGQDGQNSDNLTIFADGSPTTLNLAGQNGLDGEDGGNGNDAPCSNQPQDVTYNLRAPDGGNGGDGGDGGKGGNGGSLTIYASNLANVSQVSVNAVGGKGGQPGKTGIGGKGCQCSQPYWTIQTCTGNPGDSNYNCTTREFNCRDGNDGKNGRTGRTGKDGLLGKLTLINLNKPLEPDQPVATIPMSQLKDKGFILSQNTWETRSGAVSLFAPGSVIADQYLALVERLERSFLLVWNAPQSFSKFANQMVTLNLEENQGRDIVLSDEVWVEATTQKQNNVTQFVVYNAILKKEATQLKSEGLSGVDSSLQLNLVDLANQSNLISTQFRLKYRITRSDPRFRPVSDYSTRYSGEMPAELVRLNGNRFTLNLGQLPLKPDDLKSKLGVEVDLVATRSFAGYSTEQRVVVHDIIGSFR